MRFCQEICTQTEEWIAENGLIEYGGAKLTDYVNAMGIDFKTYYNWLNRHPEYKTAVERGRSRFKDDLGKELVLSLARAAKGYDAETIETIYKPNPNQPDKPTIKEMRKIKRHYPVNVAAAIFLLTNLDPEHYQNRIRNNIDIKPQQDTSEAQTIEQINAEIARLQKIDEK